MQEETVEKSTKEKAKDTSSKKPKKKSSVKKWVIIGFLVLISFLGFRFLSFRKQMTIRREAAEVQRQVMIDSWKEQGLSDEEIEEKLESFRSDRFHSEDGQRGSGFGIMRTLFRRERPGN